MGRKVQVGTLTKLEMVMGWYLGSYKGWDLLFSRTSFEVGNGRSLKRLCFGWIDGVPRSSCVISLLVCVGFVKGCLGSRFMGRLKRGGHWNLCFFKIEISFLTQKTCSRIFSIKIVFKILFWKNIGFYNQFEVFFVRYSKILRILALYIRAKYLQGE